MKRFAHWMVVAAIFAVVAVVVAGLNYSPNAYATKDLYNAAKDMYGKDVKGCKHCHVKALPKEDDHELNEVGQWLVDQKAEKDAEEIDVAWLKDYKPGS